MTKTRITVRYFIDGAQVDEAEAELPSKNRGRQQFDFWPEALLPRRLLHAEASVASDQTSIHDLLQQLTADLSKRKIGPGRAPKIETASISAGGDRGRQQRDLPRRSPVGLLHEKVSWLGREVHSLSSSVGYGGREQKKMAPHGRERGHLRAQQRDAAPEECKNSTLSRRPRYADPETFMVIA